MKPRDTHLDRLIATKGLPPGKVADPSRKTHFVQQTKAVQQPPPDHRVLRSFGSSLRLNPVYCRYRAGATAHRAQVSLSHMAPGRVVGHPGAILQGVDLMDAVESRRRVVRHRGSRASFFDRGKPVMGFTTLDPLGRGPLNVAALGAFGRWNVGPWSEAVEAIWEGKA